MTAKGMSPDRADAEGFRSLRTDKPGAKHSPNIPNTTRSTKVKDEPWPDELVRDLHRHAFVDSGGIPPQSHIAERAATRILSDKERIEAKDAALREGRRLLALARSAGAAFNMRLDDDEHAQITAGLLAMDAALSLPSSGGGE